MIFYFWHIFWIIILIFQTTKEVVKKEDETEAKKKIEVVEIQVSSIIRF